MESQTLSRLSGWALAVSGVLFALFFVLHAAGGDPPSAASVINSPYALEHTLGVAAMVLMLLGLAGYYTRHSAPIGKFGCLAFLLAFIGTALLVGVVFFDAYFIPLIALNAPQLLLATGPFNTMPGVLALAVPGVIWMAGLILLGVVVIRARLAPRPAGLLLIAGSFITNLPPEPVGPAPWALIAAGAVILGCGLAWLGLGLAMDGSAERELMAIRAT